MIAFLVSRVVTHADGRCRVGALTRVCVFVSLSIRSIKPDATRIIKPDVEILHRESWKPIYFGVRRSRSMHKKPYHRGFLHSCECWLVLVYCMLCTGAGAWDSVQSNVSKCCWVYARLCSRG